MNRIYHQAAVQFYVSATPVPHHHYHIRIQFTARKMMWHEKEWFEHMDRNTPTHKIRTYSTLSKWINRNLVHKKKKRKEKKNTNTLELNLKMKMTATVLPLYPWKLDIHVKHASNSVAPFETQLITSNFFWPCLPSSAVWSDAPIIYL